MAKDVRLLGQWFEYFDREEIDEFIEDGDPAFGQMLAKLRRLAELGYKLKLAGNERWLSTEMEIEDALRTDDPLEVSLAESVWQILYAQEGREDESELRQMGAFRYAGFSFWEWYLAGPAWRPIRKITPELEIIAQSFREGRYTSLGSYPKVWVSKRGVSLCYDCAGDAFTRDSWPDDPIVDVGVYEGDDFLTCEGCGGIIAGGQEEE